MSGQEGDLRSAIEQRRAALQELDQRIERVTGVNPRERRRRIFDRLGSGPNPARRRSGEVHDEDRGGGPRIRSVVARTTLDDEPRSKRSRREDEDVSDRRSRRRGDDVDNDDGYDEDEEEVPSRDDGPQRSVKSAVAPVSSKARRPSGDGGDKQTKARNRRMFGMLMGTLQAANKSSAAKTTSAAKFAEIEEKLKEQREKEREEVKAVKSELFAERKEARLDLIRLQQEKDIQEMRPVWERQAQNLCNFIATDTQPRIFFMPAKHSKSSEDELAKSRQALEEEHRKRQETWHPSIPTREERARRRAEGKADEHHEGDEDDEAGDHDKGQHAEDGPNGEHGATTPDNKEDFPMETTAQDDAAAGDQ